MKRIALAMLISAGMLFTQQICAQQTKNSLVIVTGTGEVKAKNDLAMVTFLVEENDKDKAVAASRVNMKMKDGIEILKKSDPEALLSSHGYYTRAIYTEVTATNKIRKLTGWTVGQYLELSTKNVDRLPATVASAQKTLTLEDINFGLLDSTKKNLNASRLEAAYQNMQEKLQVIAKAMGRNISDTSIEVLSFDSNSIGLDNEGLGAPPSPPLMEMKVAQAVQEPSFEVGESTLRSVVIAKIRFN